MKRYILVILSLVFASILDAQTISEGWHVSSYAGTRNENLSVGIDLIKDITNSYAVAIDFGYSDEKGEICLTQRVSAPDICGFVPVILAEFGLGHSFVDNGITDHNWHVYRVGLELNKYLNDRGAIFIRAEHCGRSKQGHIGWHQPEARISAGIRIDLTKD